MRARGWATALALLATGGCDALMVEPAAPEGIEVQLQVGPPDSPAQYGDFAHILAQVTRVRLTLIEGGSARDTVIPATFEGSTLRVRADLRPNEGHGWVELQARLSVPTGEAVFSGRSLLQTYRTSPKVVVQLVPVAATLLMPDDYPVQTALGDTIAFTAHAVFATGDTIHGAPVSYATRTPTVLELLDGARAVSRANGLGIVESSSLDVTVFRVVTVRQNVARLTGVGPGDTLLSVGDTFRARPFGEDPNGFPLLPGANVAWSGGGSVAVREDGRVAALTVGDGFVDVGSGSVSHRALVTVVP